MIIKSLQTRIKRSPFFIKLGSWEYWNMNVIYTPIYLYWLFLSLKARSLMFFTAANPGIHWGGLFGDSKKAILGLIPDQYLPKTLFIEKKTPVPEIKEQLTRKGIHFPLIAKPDIGERGFLVEKIENIEGLEAYLNKQPVNLLLQEYIAYPEEVSVLYYRYPGNASGHISSLTLKKFLSVTGDGTSTVRELMIAYPRARLQLETLESKKPALMDSIPPKGKAVELVSIGNHCRGTTFLNGNGLIDEALVGAFDEISSRLSGIYFGRFDIKCQSLASLKQGKDFRILEINGVKSEPTHIYQPGFSIWKAYKVLFRQWQTIYEISMENKKQGVDFPSSTEGVRQMWAFQKYKRKGYKAAL